MTLDPIFDKVKGDYLHRGAWEHSFRSIVKLMSLDDVEKKPTKRKAGKAGGTGPEPTPEISAAAERAGALVVGIGASAGGLEAFRTFFSNTPVDTGMAFVLIQHLATDHKSMLAELVGRVTAMTVMEADDGMLIAANCVYVIPPDATLTIERRTLRVVTPAPAREHRRPIDTFFASLAEDQGENAVCIVLTGTGSDGARGLRLVKEQGGLAMAQAVNDSAMSGMPQSAAATGLVDHVLAIDKMPARLVEHQRHLSEAAAQKDGDGTRPDTAPQLAKISALLRAKIGHDFSQYKEKTLVRRVQRRMQVLRIDTAAAYVAHLKVAPNELELLFREFLIGVTQFFRDPEAFEVLRATVIPKLLESKVAGDSFRIWIPACSTGEEVYSIAILVKDEMDRRGLSLNVQIFGTDIDEAAVAVARAGRYRTPMIGVSAERTERWFVQEGEDHCPIKAVREMCIFSTHSVIKDPPFSKLDLISCRNLMIYLDADLQNQVVRTFHYALRPDGTLFLGSSEGLSRNDKLFDALDKKHRIFQRLDAETVFPPMAPTAPAMRTPTRTPVAASNAEQIDRSARRALEKYSPVYVVIDSRHEILRFSGSEIGHYLGPSPGTASLNLFEILRTPLRSTVRAAVKTVFATKEPVVHNEVALKIEGKTRAVTVIAAPLKEGKADAGLCVVAFQDVGPLAARKDAKAGNRIIDDNSQALEQELNTTKTQLQAAIDEFEIVSEEMKSANEEYQSVNEELQSSNEELETSKEEMQSINEELQTINVEMGSKNELQTRLNSDLRNLFDSTEIATIFLDNDLRIKSFTPGMTDIFHLRDADRGRPITEIVTLLSYSDFQRDVRTVLRKLSIIEHEVQIGESGATFIMRVRPYRTVDNVIDGAVITFIDISERKAAEEAVRESEARYRTLFDLGPVAVYSCGASGVIENFNRRAMELWGREPVLGDTDEQFCGSYRMFRPDGSFMPHEVCPMAEVLSGKLTEVRDAEVLIERPDGSRVVVVVNISPLKNQRGKVTGAINCFYDISERKISESRTLLLMGELDHRVKNILATVSSIVSQTLNTTDTPEAFAASLEGRINALSRAHGALTQNGGDGGALDDIVRTELAAYDDAFDRVKIDGPAVMLTPKASLAFSMTIHELSTNAAKYGALSTASGRVSVTWERFRNSDPASLRVVWAETGGPAVEPPSRRGFGTMLIERTLAYEFDATVDREFLPFGLRCVIELPLTVEVSPPPQKLSLKGGGDHE